MTDEMFSLFVGIILAIVGVLVAALSPWHWLRRKLHIPPAIQWTRRWQYRAPAHVWLAQHLGKNPARLHGRGTHRVYRVVRRTAV